MKKFMIEFILITIFVYLVSLGYLYFNQRNMIYYPDTTRPDISLAEGAQIVEVATSDGLTLQGWYFPPADETMPTILHFQGNAGNQAHRVWKANLLHEKGYGVLLAGYRGYGGNPGSISEAGFMNDARAYIEFLKSRKNPIVIHGESIGTGVAARMASEYDVAGLILESAYSSIADVAQAIYFLVPVRLLLKDQFRSIDVIAKVKAPKLFIHGLKDYTIPSRFGIKLFEAAQEPKSFVLLDSAGHNDLYQHGAALHVLQFLSTITKKPKE